MNNTFNLKQAALAALLVIGTFGTAHAKSESCDASNNIQGWGIWCGVETYAAKMATENPTAAGPLPSALALRLEPAIDITDLLRKPLVPVINPDEPDVPDIPLTFPETTDPKTFVGYTRTAIHTRSNSASSTTKPELGTLTLKLDTAGIIEMTRFDAAGDTQASITLSGNDSLFGPPSNPNRSTQVILDPDPTKQSSASARKTTTFNDAGTTTYEEERFSTREAKQENGGILKEYWIGTHSLYSTSNSETSDTNTHFVAGILTPLADIEGLTAGNVTATYTGKSAFWRQDVSIIINFGEKSFSGEWKGGPFSFQADGVIVGQHIVSTAITGADSGMVQGSFFNPGAEALAGAYNATKGDVSISDTYATSKSP